MLFQPSVLKKHLADLDPARVQAAYARFRSHFADPAKQASIRSMKEEQYQEGFLRELFVDVLGYTLNPSPGYYDLTTEFKNLTDAKKADGAVLLDGKAIAVIELKGTNTTDFKKIEEQAFRYKNNHRGCRYVITSNFERLRFYVDDATEFEQFDLFALDYEAFALLWLCLAKANLMAGLPADIKARSVVQEEQVTRELYADYSRFKHALFGDLCARNTRHDRLLLFQKAQKLLDRLLFIFFAEDRGLLPPNSIHQILTDWQKLRDLDEPVSLYARFRKFFGYLHTGHRSPQLDIFGYNGGLFAPDPVLDELEVDDTVLFNGTWAITRYDFETEVDVDILGHIFEHSLNEIEEVQAEIEGRPLDRAKTKRKKDGVFYTPKYITRYIVDHTVGALCRQKQAELALRDEDYADRAEAKKKRKELSDRLNTYQTWLEGITILDPACGSGAFLNAAFTFLVAEHERIDRLRAALFGDSLLLRDVELGILENNLFGVDLNDESVEIAQLALWLRTARKGRKLSTLSQNIRVGNSLVSDPDVAGSKAFDWTAAFPQVFAQGGFDVVVGNPPYGASLNEAEKRFITENYATYKYKFESYIYFIEKGIDLLKPTGFLGFITPELWLSLETSSAVRNYISRQGGLAQINLVGENVFADVVVNSVVFTFQKGAAFETLKVVQGDSEQLMPTQNWQSHPLKAIEYRITGQAQAILEKIEINSLRFSDFGDVVQGITPYDKYRGQSAETIKNRAFHFDFKKDETCGKWLNGEDVGRYWCGWGGEWLSYGEWLAAPREPRFFEGARLLFREIPGKNKRIQAAYTEETAYYGHSVTPFVKRRSLPDDTSLMFFLAVANSALISFYGRLKLPNLGKDIFPKINPQDIKMLPVPKCGKEAKAELAGKAESISKLISDSEALAARFLRHLLSKHPGLQATKKLEAWPSLPFADFLKEVKKQKVAWSLREEAEWMGYFEEEQRAAQALQDEAQRLDAEIDRLVYTLYGLTEEEVEVVERG